MNIFFDLRNSEFMGNIVIEGDGAGRDEIKATFLLEDGRFGGASKGPKLEEYVRAVGVNGIRNLCGSRLVPIIEVRHGKRRPLSNQQFERHSKYRARSDIPPPEVR